MVCWVGLGWVGWPFFSRQRHWQVTGRLRAAVPTVLGVSKFSTSSYALPPCRNHLVVLRRHRSTRFPGQAPYRELWHYRFVLGCASKAALVLGSISGHCRLTVHSSQTRFAGRLYSGARRLKETHGYASDIRARWWYRRWISCASSCILDSSKNLPQVQDVAA